MLIPRSKLDEGGRVLSSVQSETERRRLARGARHRASQRERKKREDKEQREQKLEVNNISGLLAEGSEGEGSAATL